MGCLCDSPAITLAFLVLSDVHSLWLRSDCEGLGAGRVVPVLSMSGADDFKQAIIIKKARRGCRYVWWLPASCAGLVLTLLHH